MNLSKFSVKKPITIIMALAIILLIGGVSVYSLKTDLFPSMNMPYAIVSTSFNGAGPEEVEMKVTKPIEGVMATVSNLKSIDSVSSEGSSMVILEFTENTDMDNIIVEMRESLNMIDGYMPENAGESIIVKINPNMMAIHIFSISVESMGLSDASIWIEDEILPRFERIEGVANISLMGTSKDEIHVTIDKNKLKVKNDEINKDFEEATKVNYDNMTANIPATAKPEAPVWEYQEFITTDMIKRILQGQNFTMPSGYVSEEGKDYMVRVGDAFEDIDDIGEIVIFSNDDAKFTLDDISTIELVDVSKNSYTYVNSQQAIMLSVQKQNTYATTEVTEKVNAEIDSVLDDYDNVEIKVTMDQGEYINFAVGSVSKNLLYGAILAVIILWLFLRDIKPTFVVTVAIPISLLAAFAMMYFFGITLNIVSMGGLALGIGMLVDNSIVVIENIYRLRQKNSGDKASIKGAKQVAGAITASTLTTISVFLPIVFLQGFTAEIFKEMALTISCSLIASLFIALTFVPMASSQILKGDYSQKKHTGLKKAQKLYGVLLKRALRSKTIIIIFIILLLGGSVYGALQAGVEYFPESDTGQITVDVEMPKGTIFDDTAEMMDEISYRIQKIEGIETVGATIGGGSLGLRMSQGGSRYDAGSIYVLLAEDIEMTTSEIAQKIRDAVKDLDCIIDVNSQDMSTTMLTGSGISIEIGGNDFDVLEKIAYDVTEMVESVEGTTEIDNGISKSSPEFMVSVDKDKAMENGLTVAQVYMIVDKTISPSNKATSLDDGVRDYDVMVINNTNEINNLYDLENIKISTPLGETIKLKDIADVYEDIGYGSISRSDQERVLTVSAALEDDYNIGLVGDDIQELLDDYEVPDGYSIELAGENEMITDAMNDLFLALALAVMLIYMIMAAQFESFKYPLIVMTCLPLAVTGGLLALIITGNPVSIVSVIGMIVLIGIVVNNGIVMVDYTNQLKAEGMHYKKALIKAGKTRLRPIIMTALTTIFALSAMSIGIGQGAEMMQPLAITAIGGLIYSTLLTLFVVPVFYAMFDGAKEKRELRKAQYKQLIKKQGGSRKNA